jgi:hypothetical protein
MPDRTEVYPFRPWVARAGFSIVLVAAAVTVAILVALFVSPSARYGWIGEHAVWAYIGTLWLGGLKVWLGARRPVAELGGETLTLRPLHQFRSRTVRWDALRGTEQMLGGDRLIVYWDGPRGMRFVALNLNLIKGRRNFLATIDERLRSMGFVEKIVERSRYLSRRE